MQTRTDDMRTLPQPPEELYGELFYDVQSDPRLFSDSKTFVDCVPLYDPAEIRKRYSGWTDRSTEGLREFLSQNFSIPPEHLEYVSDSSSVQEHIGKLWKVLKRRSYTDVAGTLLPMPCDYIVPGGRFREIYYWDSFFTMLGLKEDGEIQTIEDMLCNLSGAIERYGFIPNGNRSYYLSRSQPPFFSLMVQLYAGIKGEKQLVNYLPHLKTEYAFWMDSAEILNPSRPAVRRVVLLPGGQLLNRYWDDLARPRPESYVEDLLTAKEAKVYSPARTEADIYRDIRAAAESGWDFSSRWLLADSNGIFRMGTIRTTAIVPVDLNCLLYHLESTIARAAGLSGDRSAEREFTERAERRRHAITTVFWNRQQQFFMDLDMATGTHTGVFSLAGVYPLFFKVATQEQADQVAEKIRSSFLQQGGLLATLNVTGQQWDAPNGWAPLHYLAIEGLKNYGHHDLAGEAAHRWMRLIEKTYAYNFRLLEKYNVADTSREGGGGEYPNQDGFGWTNGVYRYLASAYGRK